MVSIWWADEHIEEILRSYEIFVIPRPILGGQVHFTFMFGFVDQSYQTLLSIERFFDFCACHRHALAENSCSVVFSSLETRCQPFLRINPARMMTEARQIEPYC